MISEVQISGASSTNDFVKLYNPTLISIDIGGWKLRKRSQTGADYSLKQFLSGSIVDPGQSFIWANAVGGFSEAIAANVSSTETLSADNSIALIDASGTIVDALAWGIGVGQYGEGLPLSVGPASGQVIVRRSDNGVLVDTANNNNDFILK